MKIYHLLMWMCALTAATLHAERKADHVVLIGIEGWNNSAASGMKNITASRLNGSWTLEKVSVFPTDAAPNYASMLTGAGPESHGFYNDASAAPDFTPAVTGSANAFPSVYDVIRKKYPLVKTACIYENDAIKGMIKDKYTDMKPVPALFRHTDKAGEMAAEYIAQNKPLFLSVMLGGADYAGHAYGFGSSQYKESLTTIDESIGKIIQATKDAGIYDRTVFIITSTHGGIDKSHGGRSVEEMETPLIVTGCNVESGKIPNVVTQQDITPTIAYILDVEHSPDWRGRAVKEIFKGYQPADDENRIEKLRIMSWNIMDGQWKTQGKNYDEFVKYLNEKNPDICIFQEAQSIYDTRENTSDTNNRTYTPKDLQYLVSGWKELAARYGHNYWSIGFHRDNYPQVITSKYPIKKVRQNDMPVDSVVKHGYGHFKVAVDDKLFNLVTTHTFPLSYDPRVPVEEREQSTANHDGDRYRALEMEYVCNHTIGKSADTDNEYWLMCGDFNAPSSVDIEQALKSGNQWTYDNERSHPQWLVNDYIREKTPYIDIVSHLHPNEFIISDSWKRRIDFVYCSPKLAELVERAEIPYDFNDISDHRPVIVDINLVK